MAPDQIAVFYINREYPAAPAKRAGPRRARRLATFRPGEIVRHEHLIRDEDDYIAHVDYIHYNPVKHGHADRPIDWLHSSIHRYVRDGILTPDWGTHGEVADRDLD